MDREFLEAKLAEGLSLEKIGELVGKHPSTVAYWLRKHGLRPNGVKFTPRGALEREQLEPLVAAEMTLAEMADHLDRSIRTVRYWLERYGLRATNGRRITAVRRARAAGIRELRQVCQRHGKTEFVLEGRGYYRCKRCRAEAVAQRRRAVKRILVEEAGGRCAICGYDRMPAALQFHHVDPGSKAFSLSDNGISRSLSRARLEARKCILLCANCHSEVENGSGKLPPGLAGVLPG
jgi:transposase